MIFFFSQDLSLPPDETKLKENSSEVCDLGHAVHHKIAINIRRISNGFALFDHTPTKLEKLVNVNITQNIIYLHIFPHPLQNNSSR